MPLNLRALYLLLFMIFQAILLGQNQFGRIFIENVNPLLINNTKEDTVKKQTIISDQIIIDEQIADTITTEPKITPVESIEKNIVIIDNTDTAKPIASSNKPVTIKTKNKNLKIVFLLIKFITCSLLLLPLRESFLDYRIPQVCFRQ